MKGKENFNLKMNPNHTLIMGKNCILEVLLKNPERIVTIFTCQKESQDEFYKELTNAKLPIQAVSKKQLEDLVGSSSHQGFVAALKQRSLFSAQQFLTNLDSNTPCLVIMLDSIFDPHNFGAILRAAECFGVDALVYSKNRGTEVSPVVAKVSSGASELVPLIKVSNLVETAKLFQKEGFTLIGADVGENACSLAEFKFPERTLLILGSEGEGIQPLLKKQCDVILKIPMFGRIDSLNVSQAAAIFLFAWRR